MATTTQRTQKPDWTLFRYHFAHSTYISKGWNWFLELSGKLAAPILLTSVLYAGLKLAKPEFVAMYLSGFDVFISVAQLLALDMGGLGLLAIAKHAARGGDSEGAKRAKRVAFAMFALMMITLSLSSVASAFGWREQDYAWVVGLLLIARAILSVLYGILVHDLGMTHADHAVVRSAEIQEHLVLFTETLQRIEHSTEHNRQQSEIRFQHLAKETTEHLSHISEMLANNTETQQGFVQEVNRLFAAGFPFQLDERLQPVLTMLERHGEALSVLPLLSEHLAHSKQSLQGLIEEVNHLTASVEQVRVERPNRTKSEGSHTTETRPNANKIQLVPNVSVAEEAAKAFDKGKFVVECLKVDPEMKGSDIQRQAFEQFGQHISASYISETKTAFRREQSA